MKKPTIVEFDEQAYKEYQELQKLVAECKSPKKKPTYEQLLDSINNAVRNIKADYCFGDFIPRKYISKSTIQRYGTDKIFRVELVGF